MSCQRSKRTKAGFVTASNVAMNGIHNKTKRRVDVRDVSPHAGIEQTDEPNLLEMSAEAFVLKYMMPAFFPTLFTINPNWVVLEERPNGRIHRSQ